jgi:hypothetical protein
MHTALTGAPAASAPTHRLFIVNDENRWEIAGSYQIARFVKVPGRRALSVGNGHGWKASFAKAGEAEVGLKRTCAEMISCRRPGRGRRSCAPRSTASPHSAAEPPLIVIERQLDHGATARIGMKQSA